MEGDILGAAVDLKKHGGLHVVVIAQTPMGEAKSSLLSPDTDPHQNHALKKALQIYGRHYLATQEGIPGEGEKPQVILSRLQKRDPEDPCKAITVYGLADDSGNIHGAAFVETYHIHEPQKDGAPLEGLTHLLTYAATEPGYDDYMHNAAFHAGIVSQLRDVDKKLGFVGNSILTTEVNAAVNYDGKRASTKMDAEFEIKTGVPRAQREAYELGAKPAIIGLDGRYNHAHILQMHYAPPALAGEENQSLAHITTPDELALHLKNENAFNGLGDPLFLTAETLDGRPLTQHHLALQQAFQKQLLISIGRDRGITDSKLILDARQLPAAGFTAMDLGYAMLDNYLQGNDRYRGRPREDRPRD